MRRVIIVFNFLNKFFWRIFNIRIDCDFPLIFHNIMTLIANLTAVFGIFEVGSLNIKCYVYRNSHTKIYL